jgi:site-specific recombinase XerD
MAGPEPTLTAPRSSPSRWIPRDAVERYLDRMARERDASPHTLLNYRIDLDHWFHWLSTTGQLSRWRTVMEDPTTFRRFLDEQGEKYRRSTVLRRLGALKSFLRFLHREGVLSRNVGKLLRVPTLEVTAAEPLTEKEIGKFLDGLPTERLRDKRLKAAAELLYGTGLRISEVAALDRGDLDLRKGIVRVPPVVDRAREVVLGKSCRRAVQAYLDALPRALRDGDGPLLFNRDGQRVSIRTLQRDLRAAAEASLGDRAEAATPHGLRHACAAHLAQRGVPLQALQKLLGHKTLLTTQRYAAVDDARFEAAFDAASRRKGKAPRKR